MENAVVYARFSSHNQTENSIEAQVKAAREYATKHNLNVIGTYADRAKTGTNDNREEFQKMLKDSNKKTFSVVIVWKVDRFGRNREEIALNKHKLKKNGVRLEYVAENITDGPEGVILESVLEGFAEYYSKQLSQNSKRGIRNIAEKGGYTGGKPPYGYKIANGKYTVVPEEAKKIKEVFKLFACGFNFRDIANKLDLKDYNIRIYLKNKSYYDGVYRRCGMHIPNIIPPIITKEEFDMVQDRLYSYVKRKDPNKYILTGKLFCTCGEKYTGCGYKKYIYYKPKCNCSNKKRIKRDEIEEDVIESAMSYLTSEESIDKLTDKVYKKLNQKIKNINPAKKKESLIAKKRNLLKLVEDGALPYEDLRDRIIELDAELKKTTSYEGNIINKSQVKEYLMHVREHINNVTALTDLFINKVIVDPKTLEWTIKFGPSHFGTD